MLPELILLTLPWHFSLLFFLLLEIWFIFSILLKYWDYQKTIKSRVEAQETYVISQGYIHDAYERKNEGEKCHGNVKRISFGATSFQHLWFLHFVLSQMLTWHHTMFICQQAGIYLQSLTVIKWNHSAALALRVFSQKILYQPHSLCPKILCRLPQPSQSH